MFLPHNLASSVRRSKKFKKQQTVSEVNSELSIMASSLSKANQRSGKLQFSFSSKKNKKKSKAKNSSIGISSSLSKNIVPSQSFMARGWALLSNRAKRQSKKQAPTIAAVAQKDVVPCVDHHKPCTSGTTTMTLNSGGNVTNASTRNEATDAFSYEEQEKRNIVSRGMNKLRRSFRKSFRHVLAGGADTSNLESSPGTLPKFFAKSSLHQGGNAGVVETTSCGIHNGKIYCQPDEAAVRSAACSFQVKYLGAVEVFESRGMHVCESALQQLRAKKRQTKSVLYVTGDGIRVVDQESNRGLILDQTIEKVSFCAPDRHNDKGFAYICRDGATKRWMCHGFHSSKESGERLSHAVGCAFTICLEKKRKRDAETAAYKSGQALALITNSSAGNFDRVFESAAYASDSSKSMLRASTANCGASFRRQLSLAERKLDPQTAIVVRTSSSLLSQNNLCASNITPSNSSDVLEPTSIIGSTVNQFDVFNNTTITTLAHLNYLNPNGSGERSQTNGVPINACTSLFAASQQRNINNASLSNSTSVVDVAPSVMAFGDTPLSCSALPVASTIKPRPVANPSLFERQGSFTAPIQSINPNSFKRFNSLRTDLIGLSHANRHVSGVKILHNEPIYEGEDEKNLSEELCSLNFADNSYNNSVAFALNDTNFPTSAVINSSLFQNTALLHTNQSFDASALQSEFLEQFSRNNEKRTSRADEWLAQILKKSTANGGDVKRAANAFVAGNNIDSQTKPLVSNNLSNNADMIGRVSYFNHVTQMTSSNSFTIPSFNAENNSTTNFFNFTHSLSVDGKISSIKNNFSTSNHSATNFPLITTASVGTGMSGPPPNQPPPPLPPSVASRLNVSNSEELSLSNSSLSFNSSTLTTRGASLPLRDDYKNNAQNDSLGFVQNLMKSPYMYVSPSKSSSNIETQSIARDVDDSNQQTGIEKYAKTSSLIQKPYLNSNLKDDSIKETLVKDAQGHTRKLSATARMSIEYELLEETDAPPQSPPPVSVRNENSLKKLQINLANSDSTNVTNKESKLVSPRHYVSNVLSTNDIVSKNYINNSQTSTNSTISNFSNIASAECNKMRIEVITPRNPPTISPTGAESAEAAIRAIRLATLSSLESAETAISALHNSTKSDDPFDVKWSADVLQKSAHRKSSATSLASNCNKHNNKVAPQQQ